MALKHFPWEYYMKLCHAGPHLGLFRGPLGPCRPLKRHQGGLICNIIMYYAPEKCFRVISGHAGTFWVMKGHFGSWRLFIEALFRVVKGHFGQKRAILGNRGPFWCFFGSFWGPVGLWKGPSVVQHDKVSCNIPMGSVLGLFGVIQRHFGSWRAIFGHKGPFLVLFWVIMGPPWASEKGPGWSNMTYNHVIYPLEVF